MIVGFLFSALYLFSLFISGYGITKVLFPNIQEPLLQVVSSSLVGIVVGTFLTYELAVIISPFTKDVLVSGILYTGIVLLFSIWYWRKKSHKNIKLTLSDLLLGGILYSFSWVFMWKSFHGVSEYQFSIGSNEVFDFGHSIGIIRSIAWGNNIPYSSPFVSGTSHVYHFLFQFLVALLERSGVPLSLAVTFISSVGFCLLLFTCYLFVQEFFGWSKKTSLVVFPFVLLHSTLMFILFYLKHSGLSFFTSIIHNSTYLSAGPFDGSIISLYTTLNVFANQRHLAFGLGVYFLLYLLIWKNRDYLTNKQIFGIGLVASSLFLWHIPLSIGLIVTVLFFFLFSRKKSRAIYFLLGCGIVSVLSVLPWLIGLVRGEFVRYNDLSVGGGGPDILYILQFGVLNFGVAIPFFLFSLVSLKRKCISILPILVVSGVSVALGLLTKTVDQKMFNVFLIIFRMITAYGFIVLYKKNYFWKITCLVAVIPLFLSGVIDLFVIKNDFLYTALKNDEVKISQWIAMNTKPDTVFLSYQDMHDPVVFAGRRTYYGFFQQGGSFRPSRAFGREEAVKSIYEASSTEELNRSLTQRKIDFIIIPKGKRTDFLYTMNLPVMETLPIVFEDQTHVIVSSQNSRE